MRVSVAHYEAIVIYDKQISHLILFRVIRLRAPKLPVFPNSLPDVFSSSFM